MMNLEKIHVVSTKETWDVVGIKKDLDSEGRYTINVLEGDCDGVNYYIDGIPLYVCDDGYLNAR